MRGYLMFRRGLPYIHTAPDYTIHNPIRPSANGGITSLSYPYGVIIDSDNRHCIYSGQDSQGNYFYEYLTNGNTTTRCVTIDENASLCANKYNKEPKIPDTLNKSIILGENDTYHIEGDGFMFCEYYAKNNVVRYSNTEIDYRSKSYTGSVNTNAISAISDGQIKLNVDVDVDYLWSNLSAEYNNSFANANYIRRSDQWFDTGDVGSWGLYYRLNGTITTPNFANGEFLNATYRNELIGRALIGVNLDLVDDDKTTMTGVKWRLDDVHRPIFEPNKTTINLSEFSIFGENESPSDEYWSSITDDFRDISGIQVNTVSYNIPICTSWDEVINWLDNGILPDGWNEGDDDLDTNGESEPNENDSIADNQGSTPSNYSLSGVDLYLVDIQDISDFKNAFFDFDLSNSLINKFTGLYSGLENYVIGLKYYPCGLPPLSTGTSTVKVGNLQLELNDTAITLNRINGYQSSILYSGTLQLPEYYQSILDYGGYNKAWLYLPYYGTVPIDVSILRTRTLKVVYTLDIISGSATIILYIGNSAAYTPMNIYSCEMGCDIPLTLQSGIELGTKIVDLSTNVLTATIGGATGGAVGAIAGGVQNITNGVDLSNMTQICGRSNSLAMQGAPLYPSLLLMKPKYPKNYQGSYGNLVGKPSCVTSTLSAGFNKVLNGKPNVNGCTQSEYEKLVSLLNEGVWI